MLSCYIVDDEKHSIDLLTEYLLHVPQINLIGTNTNPIKGLNEVIEKSPNFVFLDVDMPSLTGLEFYNIIKDKTVVIFTTAHAGYAVNAFNYNAVDFLLKPITLDRFLICIQKLLQRKALDSNIGTLNEYLYIQSGVKGKIIKIRYQDILYIESLNNYIIVNVIGEKHTIYISLKEVLEILPPNCFTRVHKSFIVNEQNIISIEGNQINLKDKRNITIGLSYKTTFFEKIEKYIIKKQ